MSSDAWYLRPDAALHQPSELNNPAQLEFERTKELLRRFLPLPPAQIVDVRGAMLIESFVTPCDSGYETISAATADDCTSRHLSTDSRNHRSATAAISRLFLSSINMCPLPLIPTSARRMKRTVETRACRRYATVQ